jgi:hypothetical protein
MVHSENVASALTFQANTTVTANTGVSPDGNTTADTVLFALSSYRLRSFTIAASTSYSASLFFKNINFAGTETITLNVSDGVYGPISAVIQPDNGTATFTRNTLSWSSVSGVVQNYGNGWYRVAVSGTSIGGGTGWYELTSQVSKSALFWGLQFEQSAAYPTTYIPTTTAAVTRNADVASRTGVSSWIGQTQGTFFVEFVNDGNNNSTTDRILSVSDGTTNNRMYLARLNTNRGYFVSAAGGTQTVELISASTLPIGLVKMAIAYNTNDVVMYINGAQAGTDTTATTPATSNLYIGQENGGTTNCLYKPYNQAAIFTTRLTNSQLQSLTTL